MILPVALLPMASHMVQSSSGACPIAEGLDECTMYRYSTLAKKAIERKAEPYPNNTHKTYNIHTLEQDTGCSALRTCTMYMYMQYSGILTIGRWPEISNYDTFFYKIVGIRGSIYTHTVIVSV